MNLEELTKRVKWDGNHQTYEDKWIKEACRQLGVTTTESSAWDKISTELKKVNIQFIDHARLKPKVMFIAPFACPNDLMSKLLGVDISVNKVIQLKEKLYLVALPSELNYYSPENKNCTVYMLFKDRKFAEAACLLK